VVEEQMEERVQQKMAEEEQIEERVLKREARAQVWTASYCLEAPGFLPNRRRRTFHGRS